MPIIDKPQPGAPSAQVDDHASEAAKMRRTREQAYFNSYDFDAIEVLPYDEDEHTHNRTTSRHSKWQQRPRQRQQQPMSPHNQPRPPTATQTLPPHSPSLGRRRLQQHSAATLGSSGSGSAASSRSSSSRQQRIKYSYLQRLGAFFGSDAQVHNEVDVDVDAASSSGGSSRGVAEGVIGGGGGGGAGDLLQQQQQQQQHELTIMGSDPAMVENANFLLPRAMLKYQGIVGNANSMPLAVLSSPYSTGASNGSSNNNNNNNNNTKSAKSTPTPSATSTLLAAAVATTPTANSPTSRPSKNRQSQLGRDEHGTGFPPTTSTTTTTTTLKTATTTMSTAMPTSSSLPGKSSTLARNKKKSTGSTTASTSPPHVVVVANSSTPTTATTTTMVPPTAVDRKLAENVVDTMGVRKGSGQQAKMAKTTNTTISTANTVISMPTMKTKSTIDRRTLTKTAATKAPATTTISTTTKTTGPSTLLSEVQVEPRERIGSHQSHYSTDKSGSSGYYSSNVCSTYSIEEHIYCEPVVDVLDANTKSGSSSHTLANNKKPINSDHNYNQNHNNHNYQNHNHNKQSTTTKTVTTTSLSRKLDQGEKLLHRTKVMNGEGSRVDGDGGGGGTGVGDDGPDDEDGGGRRGGCGGLGRTLDDQLVMLRRAKSHHQPSSSATATAFGPFSENLRILETSIENLDRHLKAFPSLSSQERIASFMQSHHGYFPHGGGGAMDDKLRPYHQLPTIMEGYDSIAGQQQQQQRDADGRWPEVAMTDDSLLDIDLDSFLLVDERKAAGVRKSKKTTSKATEGGIDNPSFLAEELEENHYKCAKYINSCPEDAYRVDSDIVVVHGHGNGSSSETATGSASQKSSSMEHFVKRYEDQIHFQNTRELLEDVRDKIRLLSQSTTTTTTTSNSDLHSSSGDSERRSHNQAAAQAQAALDAIGRPTAAELPKELEGMIKTLKLELEAYLDRMNQHSELEIRQLCSGLVKNQHIVRMKKAFERRRSIASLSALDSEYDFSAYEAIRDGVLVSASGVPLGIRQQITSIRCASDPNFKMKRKSLTEVFPVVVDCYGEGGNNGISNNIINSSSGVNINNNNVNNNALVAVGSTSSSVSASASSSVSRSTSSSLALAEAAAAQSQLQRNLSFHQPILNQLDSQVGPIGGGPGVGGGGGSASGGSAGDSGDKDSIMEWHRQKPSIWELYYGTNRMSQSLLGKRGVIVNTNQAAMSYPSSRPESDFTLDLPRAEQLRIKMEKEKKFRQRCRYITSFLSLVFFLLTVMVVSLVLTRGKRMFGSMI